MKKLVAILLCSCLCLSLAACGNKDSTANNSSEEQSTDQIVECKYFDMTAGDEHFTDETIISLTIPIDYVETPQESLLHKSPIYQIGEYKSSHKSISVFQYTDTEFNFDNNIKLSGDWVMGESEDNTSAVFYTKTDKVILGISITNIDKSELTQDNAIGALNYLIGQELTIEEQAPDSNNDYLDASNALEPAHIGDWIAIRMYNEVSGEYEPLLFSITNLYVDSPSNSMIDRYNNIGRTKLNNKEITDFSDHGKSTGTYEDIIYEYSVYYPSAWTTNEDGIIENTEIPITLCNENDTSTTIHGELNLYKSVHDFNDVYMATANSGEDFTAGIGTYSMVVNFKNYLIKIETADGPRYYSVK